MRSVALVLGAALLLAGTAFAAPPEQCPAPRRAWIPGGVEDVEHVVHVPPCLEDRRVPIYTVTQEPVYGCRSVPRYGAVKVAVEGVRDEPVYEVRRTPICGVVTVPVYSQRCVPVLGVDLMSWGEERLVPWFSTTESVQCGTRQEKKVLGYRDERVQVGTAKVRYQTGWRTERRFLGWVEEQFVASTREVRRVSGYRTEVVVVAPAREQRRVQAFQRPGRWVTVSDAVPRPALLANTEDLLTEAQFAAALAPARR